MEVNLLTIDFILNIYNHRSTINGLSMVNSSDPITTSVPSPRTSRCRHSHWPQRRALNRWPSALSTGKPWQVRWRNPLGLPWLTWTLEDFQWCLPCFTWNMWENQWWRVKNIFFSLKNIWKHLKTTKTPMVKSWKHNFSRLKCDRLGLYATLSNTCICNTLDVNGSVLDKKRQSSAMRSSAEGAPSIHSQERNMII